MTITAISTASSSLVESKREAIRIYEMQFGAAPRWLVAAPGRVNLIGEHTDYNDGFVLPMAIDRYAVIAAGPAPMQPDARVFSANLNEAADIRIRGEHDPGPQTWASYVQGVVAGCQVRGLTPPDFNAVIHSTIPLGGGLSSSAALEVAVATLIEAMCENSLDPTEKALLCQEAEHRYAGVPCGIMDQFSSVFCQADHLMLLDCRSQAVELVPLRDGDVTVLIINSNVRHQLVDGEYALRRAQCEAAAEVLGVVSLRDATSQQLRASREQLTDVQFCRSRHVVSEIERTIATARGFAENDWETVGRFLYASHDSLSDDYEVSCPELDLLVDLARQLGDDGGVIGSRMTGGGFGGCTVSLVRTDRVAAVMQSICNGYRQQTGIEATAFTTRPARGAHVLPGAAP